jgi:UDP-N-acetylmuramate dehydrogenase
MLRFLAIILQALPYNISVKIHNNIPFAPYTSLHVGGNIKTMIDVEAGDNLSSILHELPKNEPLLIIGQGTNSLVSDHGFQGTVIRNIAGKISLKSSNHIEVDSGVDWDTFVKFAIQNKLWGVELMSGIPGTIGAAITGNIAAYGQSIADTLQSITVYDCSTKKTKIINAKELKLNYRQSKLQTNEYKNLIIVSALFKLSHEPVKNLEYQSALNVADELGLSPNTLKNCRTIILEARRRAGSLLKNTKDGPFTAGSFFKNPIVTQTQADYILSFEESSTTKSNVLAQNKLHSGSSLRVSAALVLLAAGFKRGQTWGKVQLHKDHILKLENTGGATAQEIYDVAQLIIKTVKQKLDINLEPEVRFIGHFNDH